VNVKDYIESGILEAYILGSLTPEEEAQVVANIALYPEVAAEVAEIERAMHAFAKSMAKEPSPEMQDKIWDAIQQQSQSAPANMGNDSEDQVTAPKLIQFTPEHRKQNQWAQAAVWVALVGSLLVNIMFWFQKSDVQQKQVAMQQHIDTMQQKQAQFASLINNYEAEKRMMADTAMQTIVMHTVQANKPMAATMYWNKGKGEAYVSIGSMPPPPDGMQYQLWVIQDGKPVDMGTLPNNMAQTPAMLKAGMSVTSGQAFAISLEKAGGNPTPTTVYVVGKMG